MTQVTSFPNSLFVARALPDRPLRDRVVLVTGGASRTGGAIALAFASRGARVCVTDEDGASVTATVNLIRAENGKALAVQADLGEPGAVDALVRATESTLGGVDLLIHHASRAPSVPVPQLTDAELDDLWHVDVLAGFLLTRRLVPGMKERGGGFVLFTREMRAWSARAGLGPHETGTRIAEHAAALLQGRVEVTARGLPTIPELHVRRDGGHLVGAPFGAAPHPELQEALEHLARSADSSRPRSMAERAA